jgi:hypothetical protein
MYVHGPAIESQSYDFGIYSYNASGVVGYSVFQSRRKCFVLKTRQATRGVVNFYNAGVVV